MGLDKFLDKTRRAVGRKAAESGLILLLGGAYPACGDEARNSEINPYQAEEYESTDTYCSDRKDNNGNGFVDCDDFGCSFSPYVTVCGERENTDEFCSDGADNDQNRFIDCRDYSCSINLFVRVCGGMERTEEACRDEKDNDGNGMIDCRDDGCLYNPYVKSCEN